MALPPLFVGAVKLMVACALPPVAVPIVGAPGTVAVCATACVTSVAAKKLALPDWLAAITHVPTAFIVTVVPTTEQIDGEFELYSTVKLDEADAVGLTLYVLPETNPRLAGDCAGNVIACVAWLTVKPWVTEVAAL